MAVLFTWSAQSQECAEETAKLLPADGAELDDFGRSVSISGDTTVIGARFNDGNDSHSGSAYVFTRSGGVWTQQAKLVASDGGSIDYFGQSVSLSGDTVVIGAHGDNDNGITSGSAYVFTLIGGVWTQQAKILPDDGAADNWFGFSVSLSGDTAILGAWGESDNNGSGSAYVFRRSDGAWTQQAKLLSDDGAELDRFGYRVSISGDTALIGAHYRDDNGTNSGAAYVFTRSEGVWTQQAKLLASDGAAHDWFGNSVSIIADTAVIGAWRGADNGADSGSAYVFKRNGGVWTQQAKLLPSDGEDNEKFGWSVSVIGDTAVIGALHDDDNGFESGSAYVFDLAPCAPCVRDPAWLCDGDVDGDGQVNPVDSGLVQASFGSTDEQDMCNYDVDCDGQINPVDAGIVQSLFGTCEAPRDVCP